jgi:putative transcriptional regulator
LEWEIFNNQWLIIPADLELMFDTSLDERWNKALTYSGVNMATLIPNIGLA